MAARGFQSAVAGSKLAANGSSAVNSRLYVATPVTTVFTLTLKTSVKEHRGHTLETDTPVVVRTMGRAMARTPQSPLR
jgi:hypothetical protein